MLLLTDIKQRIKARDTVTTRFLYRAAKGVITLDVPPVRVVYVPLHAVTSAVTGIFSYLTRTFYWKPVFMTRIANRPKRMNYFGSGMPYIGGPLNIVMGDDCRISAQIALFGRAGGPEQPELIIGNNVGIGWRTGIYVGRKITIGNNVRIAGEGSLSGYPGHPLDASARARGEPDLDDQAKSIVLEDDVWLARGVIVNGGVTIGRGTVVAAGSVVTHDLPPGVLAGGTPARVIKVIDSSLHPQSLGLAA